MGYDRAPREEHEVTCANCGKQTTVPFKPTGDRPVYCRDCFAQKAPPRRDGGGFRSGGDRRSGGGDRGFGGSRGPREMHDTTCSTCGKAIQVPFRPTPGRAVYCDEHFRR